MLALVRFQAQLPNPSGCEAGNALFTQRGVEHPVLAMELAQSVRAAEHPAKRHVLAENNRAFVALEGDVCTDKADCDKATECEGKTDCEDKTDCETECEDKAAEELTDAGADESSNG